MKVKRYFAPNMRSALEQVKREQGPDVLILSNRKVDGGIELLTADEATEHDLQTLAADGGDLPVARQDAAAATDDLPGYAERPEPSFAPPPADNVLWTDANTIGAMQRELSKLTELVEAQLSGFAWSAFSQQQPTAARLLRVFTRLGFCPSLGRDLVSAIPQDKDFDAAWHHALSVLMTRLPVLDGALVDQARRIAVVGSTGVGKTTLISKLAAQHALEHGADSLALVSLDDRRLGALEQLRAFGRLLGVQVHGLREVDELDRLLASLDDHALVLIDTPGAAADDPRYTTLVNGLRACRYPLAILNAVSATTDYLASSRMQRAAAALAVDAAALTKLDEAATLGPSLSAVIESDVPLAYISSGQRVPDDLGLADSRSLIEQAVELGRAARADTDPAVLETGFAL